MKKILATLQGEPLHDLPHDLYIPPQAMEVFLEIFSGPLDLLLYLIKRDNIDIMNIPIAEITRQYMEYVEAMKLANLELAAEYLVMAALLAEIKSRCLLPEPNLIAEEIDPRAELVRRLLEYERFKQAAEQLEACPRLERDIFEARAECLFLKEEKPLPVVKWQHVVDAIQSIIQRASTPFNLHIKRETFSIQERMDIILTHLTQSEFQAFIVFFKKAEGRPGLVVTFMAVLELLSDNLIESLQSELFAPLYLRAGLLKKEVIKN